MPSSLSRGLKDTSRSLIMTPVAKVVLLIGVAMACVAVLATLIPVSFDVSRGIALSLRILSGVALVVAMIFYGWAFRRASKHDAAQSDASDKLLDHSNRLVKIEEERLKIEQERHRREDLAHTEPLSITPSGNKTSKQENEQARDDEDDGR